MRPPVMKKDHAQHDKCETHERGQSHHHDRLEYELKCASEIGPGKAIGKNDRCIHLTIIADMRARLKRCMKSVIIW